MQFLALTFLVIALTGSNATFWFGKLLHHRVTDAPKPQTTTRKTYCTINGKNFSCGKFQDPRDKCSTCTCFSSGIVKCQKKVCKPLPCGYARQIQTSDRCCKTCDPQCGKCNFLWCPKLKQETEPRDCCPKCVWWKPASKYGVKCMKGGKYFSIGEFTDPENPCDTCTCYTTRKYECKRRPCQEAKCGVNKQKNDTCGCPICDGSCNAVLCKNLMCPQDQRYFTSDSCCDSCKCLVDGQLFPEGEFKDPSDQCNTCECFDNGNYECKKRPCEEARCGVNRQEKEYCGCHVCDESCRNVKCPQIDCPKGRKAYSPNSCCESCFCIAGGKMQPKGSFDDPADPCKKCECYADGDYACKQRACPVPQCGLNKQIKDACGCPVCDDSCRYVKCAKVDCPNGRAAYDPDSCCESCFCVVGGKLKTEGPFVDPAYPCKTCECYPKGDYNCQQQACPIPRCGVQKQIKDKCGCPVCVDSCKYARCPTVVCPQNKKYFEPDSCCETCQCLVDGKWIPEGPFGDRCDACVCKWGAVKCSPPACPTKPLQCVDPVINENCNWHCPNGPTCFINQSLGLIESNVLKHGEHRVVYGNQICISVSYDYWTPNCYCVKMDWKRAVMNLDGNECIKNQNW